MFEPHEDGFDEETFPDHDSAPGISASGEMTPEEEISKIRKEGLTARQLRLARRMAQKHAIKAGSDFEAVMLLRRKGIDPFDHASIVGLASSHEKKAATSHGPARTDGAGADGRIQLPQTLKPGTVPSTEVMNEGTRAREILKIQRDIARRRRRKQILLAARLAFFVFLPTILAGYYYWFAATPMYATRSAFVIQKSEGMGNSNIGSLFSGTQLATNQDSVAVQAFLQSPDAMQRLDQDQGFKKVFQSPGIDPFQRLPENATNSQAYKLYRRMVKIGYDPSEGIIRMEVIAPNPQKSAAFSRALISYAEQQVDQLTARARNDQMKDARKSYEDAEDKVFAAQIKVQELQEKVGILDPVSENSLVMGQISNFQLQLQQKRLELGQLTDNPSPNMARVEGVEGEIQRLQNMVRNLRSQLTKAKDSNESLAAVTGQLQIAQGELQTRQTLLAAAAQQMETARIEANKQVRYLEMGVRPIVPDEATYPRAFENTLLAFLIFSGIYLMLSLTASILREQVST